MGSDFGRAIAFMIGCYIAAALAVGAVLGVGLTLGLPALWRVVAAHVSVAW